MKSIISIFIGVTLMSFSAFSSEKDSKRIKFAVSLLSSISEGGSTFKVKPGTVKQMLLQLAMNEQGEDEKEFNDSWLGDNDDAWGADTSSWGSTDVVEGKSYVVSALEQALEDGEQTDANKIKFAEGMQKAKQAFAILRSIKTVQYGLAPMGAVQCGVTFASLMIMDSETGEIYQIIMEGSGC
jgi:hypothetical protein